MSWFRRDLGRLGEKAACKYLRRLGYQILERNYVCPSGEMDVICYDKDCIVFVEVKTLSDDALSDPEDKITTTKQRQVERVARAWLAAHREPDCAYEEEYISWVNLLRARTFIERKGIYAASSVAEASADTP